MLSTKLNSWSEHELIVIIKLALIFISLRSCFKTFSICWYRFNLKERDMLIQHLMYELDHQYTVINKYTYQTIKIIMYLFNQLGRNLNLYKIIIHNITNAVNFWNKILLIIIVINIHGLKKCLFWSASEVLLTFLINYQTRFELDPQIWFRML